MYLGGNQEGDICGTYRRSLCQLPKTWGYPKSHSPGLPYRRPRAGHLRVFMKFLLCVAATCLPAHSLPHSGASYLHVVRMEEVMTREVKKPAQVLTAGRDRPGTAPQSHKTYHTPACRTGMSGAGATVWALQKPADPGSGLFSKICFLKFILFF